MFYVSFKVMFIRNLSVKDILYQTVRFFVCSNFISIYLNQYLGISDYIICNAPGTHTRGGRDTTRRF